MQALVWTGRFSLVAILAILLCGSPAQAADGAWAADEAQSADDGWRRTALGWERTQAWTEPTNHGRPRDRFLFADKSGSVDRWDFHPAVLVGLQLGAVTLVWAFWSQVRRSPAVRHTFRRVARPAA
jgi:hypothetical protein